MTGRVKLSTPLWIATRPPRISSTFTRGEAAPREIICANFRHRRETADRSDQIAIAVLVVGDQLAEPGDEVMRIGVIGLRESRPFVGREFEAEETPAIAQHAVRFPALPGCR